MRPLIEHFGDTASQVIKVKLRGAIYVTGYETLTTS